MWIGPRRSFLVSPSLKFCRQQQMLFLHAFHHLLIHRNPQPQTLRPTQPRIRPCIQYKPKPHTQPKSHTQFKVKLLMWIRANPKVEHTPFRHQHSTQLPQVKEVLPLSLPAIPNFTSPLHHLIMRCRRNPIQLVLRRQSNWCHEWCPSPQLNVCFIVHFFPAYVNSFALYNDVEGCLFLCCLQC